MPRKPQLSKSKLISAWQCPKRLFLEKHHPEYGEIPARTRAQWRTGHEVGAVARDIYGGRDAVIVPYSRNTNHMIRTTRELMAGSADAPIFEATFRHENVLVRIDVLIPDDGGWRFVEVKASTSLKDHHHIDCAIQDWVLRGAGVDVTSIALAHVNNRFVYPGDGNYDGLLAEHDVTDEVRTLEPAVLELVAAGRDAVAGPEPLVRVGTQCTTPWECPFIDHCWPMQSEFPVTGLGGSRAKLAAWVNRGITDLRDIPADEITAERQQRVHRVTVGGFPEIVPGAAGELAALGYPRLYLDFETVGPAVPLWKDTRPYQAVPVQWSVHIDDGRGDGSLASLRHEEFLDLSGNAPMRPLAERLVATLGATGPVFVYTDYERRVIGDLIEWLPDLAGELRGILDRLYDLAKLVEAHYYHPSMLGSWSIKAVAPAIAPHRDYAALDGINDGTAAAEGFLEAIRPDTTPARKADLERQLRRYCRFDTEAMVEIVQFLSAADTVA